VVLVLGSCDPVPGAVVRCFDSELDLLLAWVDLVAAADPDVVLGYNIFGFDMAYLYDRARELLLGGSAPPVPPQGGGGGRGPAVALPPRMRRFCRTGRIPALPATEADAFVVQQLSSSALGDNVLRYINMHGRVVVDLMKVNLDQKSSAARRFAPRAQHRISGVRARIRSR
jgi:DNA polymerase delta subunit 1